MHAEEALESKQMSVSAIEDFLLDDDKKSLDDKIDLKEEKKPVEKKEEKELEVKEDKEEELDESKLESKEDEKPDELKEIEQELEEPDEEQLELVTPVRRREILKKYPTLFKDFPYLEKAYYREQAYTEILPTINDAKQAVEKAEVLDKFERDLNDGNTELILKATKAESPKAFNKIVDNYLPTLAKIDKDAYHHVIGNVIKHTIMQMVSEGRRSKNESLESSAAILNQFVFGSSDFEPPSSLVRNEKPEDNTEKDELNKERQAFVRQKFESARDDLNTRVTNSLKNTIADNIDPKESMTEYIRKNASREAMDTLERLIENDSRFKVIVDKLWEKAFEQNFSRESVERIKSAYHSKAKTLLPSVIKKARIEALRGMGKRVREDDDSNEKGPVSRKAASSKEDESSGKISKSADIPKGMSTLEFLNSD